MLQYQCIPISKCSSSCSTLPCTCRHPASHQLLPLHHDASVKVGGVPQCSGEVEHRGTLGTPAPFQSSVEWCGTVWNGMEWVCLDNTCHPLSPPVNPRNGKILNWS